MRYPKISIVTPSFNQGKYIEKTILSVLDQAYANLEYIIIDGGSTDETVEIIKKYEQHLVYWVSEPDNGQTHAINKGFEKSTGEIFNWINSDDYYEPGAFEKIAGLFTKYPNVDVVCGKEWTFNDEKQEEKTLNPGSIIKQNIYETIRVGIIDQPCTFFRKNRIDALFPLNESLHYVMDRQLWWGYLLKYGQANILKTNEVFTWFRLHHKSKSVDQQKFFEAETDLLRLSLFRHLDAPVILEQQLNPDDRSLSGIRWNILIQHSTRVLAAHAAHYAEKNYVKDDIETTSKLIKYVMRWKGVEMNAKEWKLWVAACLFPRILIRWLKKIKNYDNS
jgi:glycosyltransferase involved in cell wall biosynthesis